MGNQDHFNNETHNDSVWRTNDDLGRDSDNRDIVREVDTNTLLAGAIKELNLNLKTFRSGRETTLRASFEGAVHENPNLFLVEMQQYFDKAGINDSHERAQLIMDRLKGRAAKWAARFKLYRVGSKELKRKFLAYFDGQSVRIELTTALYSQRQGEKESTDEFVARKRGIAARLERHCPQDEETLTSIILPNLRPEIRSRLRGIQFTSLEQLEIAAVQVETDLLELSLLAEKPKIKKDLPRENQRVIQQRVSNPQRNDRENYSSVRCYICQGNHTARFCPRAIQSGRQQHVAAIEEMPRQNWPRHSEAGSAGLDELEPSSENYHRAGVLRMDPARNTN